MHRDAVHARTDLSRRVGNLLGAQALVDRPPRRPAVVGAKRTSRRDGEEHAIRVGWIEHDGVEAEASSTGRPLRTRAVTAQARHLVPVLTAVCRAKQRGILDAGINGVRIGQRRFQMPDTLELPRMRRAVVPLMRAGDAVIDKLVADSLPGLAAVI